MPVEIKVNGLLVTNDTELAKREEIDTADTELTEKAEDAERALHLALRSHGFIPSKVKQSGEANDETLGGEAAQLTLKRLAEFQWLVEIYSQLAAGFGQGFDDKRDEYMKRLDREIRTVLKADPPILEYDGSPGDTTERSDSGLNVVEVTL